MTCFWDGIINALLKNNIIPNTSPKDPSNLVNYLIKNNKKTIDVTWNNEILTSKQLQENYDHIKDFDSNKIRNGYDCSTFDPFLFLISQHFQIDIYHRYCQNSIKYIYNPPQNTIITYNKQINLNKKIINVASNQGHFWAL